MIVYIFCPQVSLFAVGCGKHIAAASADHHIYPFIVSVHNRLLAVMEHAGFYFTVGFHGFMEVQMVFCQVGKAAHFKLYTISSVQGNALGRNLHHHIGAACIPHSGKQPLQVQAFRSSSLGGDHFLADVVFHRADQAHFFACGNFQNMFQPAGNGGFAVGACYADNLHTISRMAVEVRSKPGKGQTVRAHQHRGNILLTGLGRNDYRSSQFLCLGDKTVAIRNITNHSNKQITGLQFSGVAANAANFHIQISSCADHIDTYEQFS